ncbi:hypothetical protein CDL12_20539 [Handroanthus impetiginosus]|uniref:Uncharacterized protein n=1 Tax=Handroanthus impetiginosus TaxID=429701 RepID=A0A2G9GNQ3_9LAMI|nr:hypothetical protein CDL12_20539 [Handroanthus impetiginosus]
MQSTGIRAFLRQSVQVHAHIDAQKQLTRSHACSFARNVASSVGACPLALTATNKFVLATITGKPKGVDQNAPRL